MTQRLPVLKQSSGEEAEEEHMKLAPRVGERVAVLIEKGEAVLRTQTQSQYGGDIVDVERYAEWRSQVLVCLEQVFGPTHTYRDDFASEAKRGDIYSSSVRSGIGILRAALEDVEQGHLQAIQQVAIAEVFSDFIDQAEHLLQADYHIPATSLAGAVLENGLRSLAERNDITVKARDDLSALNSRLAAAGTYNRLRQKQVGVWTEVRNAADHGRFEEVAKDDAVALITGVRAFLAEHL